MNLREETIEVLRQCALELTEAGNIIAKNNDGALPSTGSLFLHSAERVNAFLSRLEAGSGEETGEPRKAKKGDRGVVETPSGDLIVVEVLPQLKVVRNQDAPILKRPDEDPAVYAELLASAHAENEALLNPVEPAGMELETTAEERDIFRQDALRRDAEKIGFGSVGTYPRWALALLRDFDRMRARAEKAEAAIKQPVSDEEAEAIVGRLRRGLLASAGFVRDSKNPEAVSCMEMAINDVDAVGTTLLRILTQLRDAQARGKGMEEALDRAAKRVRNQRDRVRDIAGTMELGLTRTQLEGVSGELDHLGMDCARAALSRPEGSAST